ncbi:hypothetical protein PLICRDRAFT_37813 [Plicaturopsis crispa FD-325 SS-3]|nr:hypothetical protein PLICRDRAFT_37813 [Plicaturopsis crispa FD-325 SS-3]
MSWSLDPRRPDPARDPEGWYKFWIEELDWSFHDDPEECLVKDSEPRVQFSQTDIAQLRLQRIHNGGICQHITNIYVCKYTEGQPIEKLWAGKSVREREDILVRALRTEAAPQGLEDYWQYCPDINKEELCSGAGEGFCKMVKHFMVSDLNGKPSPNFPVLPHPEVWRLFGFSATDEAEAARPAHVRLYHEQVLVKRHCFLLQILVSMLCILVDIKIDRRYLRQPKTHTSERKEKRENDPSPLPQHVYKLVDDAEKQIRALTKEREYVDLCEHCGKQAPAASGRMMCCSGCKKVGRQVMYCSRECQVKDYKGGDPPHKTICSKILETSVIESDPAKDSSDPFTPLYTKTPSPDLIAQLYLLRRDGPRWDYNLMQPDGRTVQREFHGAPKQVFLNARNRAMKERDRASIAILRHMLGPFSEPQLEKEYGVSIAECIEAAKGDPEWEKARRY